LNFAIARKDAIAFSGSVNVPAGFNAIGAKVYFDAGGVAKVLILTKNGSAKLGGDSARVSIKSRKGVVAAQVAKYTVKFGSGTFATILAAEGLTSRTVRKAPVSMTFTFIFNNIVYQTTRSMSYTSKLGKTGTAN
jgi:hypothetical protein